MGETFYTQTYVMLIIFFIYVNIFKICEHFLKLEEHFLKRVDILHFLKVDEFF